MAEQAAIEFLHAKKLLSSFTEDAAQQSRGLVAIRESLDRAQSLTAKGRIGSPKIKSYVVMSTGSDIGFYYVKEHICAKTKQIVASKLISDAWLVMIENFSDKRRGALYHSLILESFHKDNRDVIRRSIKSIIEEISSELTAGYSDALARRLSYLFDVGNKESDEYQADMNIYSLRNFIDFLRNYPELSEPDVVLTPEGNLRAVWKRRQKEYFKLEFLPTIDIKYFAVKPNEKYRGKYETGSGIATRERIFEYLSGYQVADWVFA